MEEHRDHGRELKRGARIVRKQPIEGAAACPIECIKVSRGHLGARLVGNG
jgi:hypothetical protein